MNKLKNILSFFLQLLVLPIAAYLLFSLWMEQELGKFSIRTPAFCSCSATRSENRF